MLDGGDDVSPNLCTSSGLHDGAIRVDAFYCWGAWTRTKNKRIRIFRVANYTTPHWNAGANREVTLAHRAGAVELDGLGRRCEPLAQTRDAHESGLFAEQLHGFEERRADPLARNGGAQRAECEARLQLQLVEQRNAQGGFD